MRVRIAPAAVESTSRSGTRERVLVAARALFVKHGVDGTSMQMIADSLGITKGAIFYHFKTKRELVESTANIELDVLEAALDEAEEAESREEAREMLLEFAISRAVGARRETVTLQNDPALRKTLETGRYPTLMNRFRRVFFDLDTATGRADAAVLTAAIGHAVTDPLVDELPDDVLAAELLRVVRHLLP